MLGRGNGLQIDGVISLQSAHIGGGQFAGQIRIFSEVFIIAAPSGIAAHIDGRAPVIQLFPDRIAQGTDLVGDHGGHLRDELFIPCLAHGEAGGKAGRLFELLHNSRGDAVGGFIPPVPGADIQTRNRRGVV